MNLLHSTFYESPSIFDRCQLEPPGSMNLKRKPTLQSHGSAWESLLSIAQCKSPKRYENLKRKFIASLLQNVHLKAGLVFSRRWLFLQPGAVHSISLLLVLYVHRTGLLVRGTVLFINVPLKFEAAIEACEAAAETPRASIFLRACHAYTCFGFQVWEDRF